MKEEEDNIDDFFKDYFESLPDFHLTNEDHKQLKDSIYQKLNIEKPKITKSKFANLLKVIFSKRDAFPKLALASILTAVSIFLYMSNNNLKNDSKIVSNAIQDTAKNIIIESKTDTLLEKNDEIIINEIVLNTLSYDLTTRSLTNKNLEDDVINYIKEVLADNNLKFSINQNTIITEEFLYKKQKSFLKITIKKSSKDIVFKLLYENNEYIGDSLKLLNPKKIIQEIESKIINLAVIE